MTEAATAETDGRRLRGAQTRERIIRAVVQLAEEGDLHPPARRVAERAGVSLRNVYHHFSDIVSMRETALRSAADQHFRSFPVLDPEEPFEKKVSALAAQCSELFEATGPVRKAIEADPEAALQMVNVVRDWRKNTRNRIKRAFEPELPADRRARREMLDAIDAATSWGNWNFLREVLGRSPDAAASVLERSIVGIFASNEIAA
jgi:TetR/AcrR family transcriptional regulator of autoinduction and epiphytic fitness